MPHTVQLGTPPVGISLHAALPGEMVQIAPRGFFSSEDGDMFIALLEDYPSYVLSLLPQGVGERSSKIDHFLFVISRDGCCDIYVNELMTLGKARLRRTVEQDQLVFIDDIVDIEEVRFEGVEIPDDAGIFVLLSQGWRKGLYFDLGPLSSPPVPRDYDLGRLLGSHVNYLTFQRLFKMSDADWTKLLDVHWFPFVGLSTKLVLDLLEHARNGWDPDDLEECILAEVLERLPNQPAHWERVRALREHRDLLSRGVERFCAGDYVSCVSILFPRIEGVLRSVAATLGMSDLKQARLAEAPKIAKNLPHDLNSRLLPSRFQQFLTEVFFASFSTSGISRNSVAHGVAPQDRFTRKAALLAVLTLEQIAFHLPRDETFPSR